ncbi:hypothetical protein GGR25_001108 [Kaistia hirudinis]|uniref:Uncharacterized protein n=1 Tax=Kaistia hirudinis TaxID=1293440 RepID=A0A840AI89_9HYPH|nr:hypothetical protein [Kaistia hirudinis]MBB3930069.1 hypothetical protein [Kaistia hirudinis]
MNPMSPRERQARRRARLRAGEELLTIRIERFADLVDWLSETGRLKPWNEESKPEIEAAIARLIADARRELGVHVTRDRSPEDDLLPNHETGDESP